MAARFGLRPEPFYLGVGYIAIGSMLSALAVRETRHHVTHELRGHPTWRASAVGVYRLWRDLGYASGALLAGIAADRFGLAAAVWLVAGLTFLSGVIAAVRMKETLIERTARS